MNNQPGRPSLLPIVMLLVLIVLGAVAIFIYATIRPLVEMTGQQLPRTIAIAHSGTPAATDSAGDATTDASSAVATTADDSSVTETVVVTKTTARSSKATPVPSPTPVPLPSLSRKERVNFLLLGSDTDLKFAANQYLTQSMIVVTVDPTTNTVGMLSIPRDLWVYIPNYGYGKIQIAYEIGGIALARETVEEDFGIPIDYYAWVGLQGFQKVIDTVGGISIDVSHPVLDDAYPDDLNPTDPYAYKRLYIPAGPQHLSGTEALEYVRSRHGDLVGDFGRSARQQQLLLALKAKLTGPAMIFHLPQLTNDLSGSVRTDVPFTDLLAYANFARGLNAQDVHQIILMPPTYSQNGTSPDGTQDIVIPDWPAINQAVTQLFGSAPHPYANAQTVPSSVTITSASSSIIAQQAQPTGPSEQQSNRAPVVVATPTPPPIPTATPVSTGPVTVLVENGTAVSGLAERATSYLMGNGYRMDAPENAGRVGIARTTVTYYDQAGRSTAYAVAQLLGAVVIDDSRNSGVRPDVIVVLGSDVARRF